MKFCCAIVIFLNSISLHLAGLRVSSWAVWFFCCCTPAHFRLCVSKAGFAFMPYRCQSFPRDERKQ